MPRHSAAASFRSQATWQRFPRGKPVSRVSHPPGGSPRDLEPVQPFEVVGQTHQRPFQRHLFASAQVELAEAEHRVFTEEAAVHQSHRDFPRLARDCRQRTKLSESSALFSRRKVQSVS